MTSDDQRSSPDYALTYNDNDRLASLTAGGSALASYTYDANEHRVIKTVSGGSGYTHHFMYDRDGHLIAESDNTGTVIREYIWLGGLPVGLVDSSGTPTLYFIHADHLATPQKVTDGSKTLVWDAQIQPFGEIAAVSGALTQLLQFPGQYHDAETGFNDNWHRTYDPSTGRYLQSDPLGIGAGPNVYAYAEGNPISYVDPTGRDVWIEGPSGVEPAGHQSVNVGNPNGAYDSYSFGVNGDPWLGGEVYRDNVPGGALSPDHYLKTTTGEDTRVRAMLDTLVGRKEPYRPWNTCRNFSQQQFNKIKDLGIGVPMTPPQRTPAPGSKSPNVPSSTSPTASDNDNMSGASRSKSTR